MPQALSRPLRKKSRQQPHIHQGEEEPEDSRRDAEHLDHHQRGAVDIAEEAAEGAGIDQRVAEAGAVAQNARVGRDEPHRHVRVAGEAGCALGEPEDCGGEEEGGEECGERVDAAPAAEGEHEGAEARPDHRRDDADDADLGEAPAEPGAVEEVADHGEGDHGAGAGAGALKQAPEEQHRDRAREGAEDGGEREEGAAGDDHGAPAVLVGERAEGDRGERVADEEEAQGERRLAGEAWSARAMPPSAGRLISVASEGSAVRAPISTVKVKDSGWMFRDRVGVVMVIRRACPIVSRRAGLD